jgi:hypothetical protein
MVASGGWSRASSCWECSPTRTRRGSATGTVAGHAVRGRSRLRGGRPFQPVHQRPGAGGTTVFSGCAHTGSRSPEPGGPRPRVSCLAQWVRAAAARRSSAFSRRGSGRTRGPDRARVRQGRRRDRRAGLVDAPWDPPFSDGWGLQASLLQTRGRKKKTSTQAAF